MDTELLKLLQDLPLEMKIKKTKLRIREWYDEYQGDVYISFSGGKDSTVLLDIARQIYPDIKAVFVDTGLEYPEIKDFIKTIENVEWLKPKMNFKEVIKTYGYPLISKEVADNVYRARRGSQNAIDRMNGLNPDGTESSFKQGNIKYKYLLDAPFEISNKCCNIMKKKPFKEYEKSTELKPILATMACESTYRKTGYLQTGCNAFNKPRPISQPMGFWKEQDVLQYLKDFNIPYASCYGEIVEENGILHTTKCERTGCMFCGFGCHLDKEPNRFQKMKDSHPKLYDYCIREENGLGMGKILDYIGVKY